MFPFLGSPFLATPCSIKDFWNPGFARYKKKIRQTKTFALRLSPGSAVCCIRNAGISGFIHIRGLGFFEGWDHTEFFRGVEVHHGGRRHHGNEGGRLPMLFRGTQISKQKRLLGCYIFGVYDGHGGAETSKLVETDFDWW